MRGAALLVLLALAVAPPAQPEPEETRRTGCWWYFVEDPAPAEASRTLFLWVALPLDRPGQKATVHRFVPEPTEILEDPTAGNHVAFWRVDDPAVATPLAFRYEFEAVNSPVRTAVDPARVRLPAADSPEARRWTVSEPWLELDPEIAARAREIVGSETNPWLQAGRVFDWVKANLTYDYPDMADRGVRRTFARGRGDCGEFAHAFIALMRTLGVPARLVTANWYQGGGHAWAEFYLEPYGWIPTDPSMGQVLENGLKGQLTPQQVDDFVTTRGIGSRDPRWLLGNVYTHRLEVFVGENVEFTARTPGGSRTFHFMQPGGSSAFPAGIELAGFGRTAVHGGFFAFGDDAADEAKARERIEDAWVPSLLTAGRYERAARALERALERRPGDATRRFQLGVARLKLEQWGEAEAAFRASLAGKGGSTKRTTDAWSHVYLGMCLDALGRRDEALREYQAALDTDAEHGKVQDLAKGFLAEPFRAGK